MSLSIDLSKIRDPRKGKFDSIELGPYVFSIGDVNNLILKTGDNIIAEYKNGDWLFNVAPSSRRNKRVKIRINN